MYETCSVTEVARNFADYVNRVVYRGERFVLVRGNGGLLCSKGYRSSTRTSTRRGCPR